MTGKDERSRPNLRRADWQRTAPNDAWRRKGIAMQIRRNRPPLPLRNRTGSARDRKGRAMVVLASLSAWILILVLAILNGIFREAVLLPNLGRPASFLISGILLSCLIVIVAVLLARRLHLISTLRCLFTGLLWLSLTLIFEFGFGGLMQGKTWAEMMEAYTFRDGNLWPMVLLTTLFAPLLAARMHRKRSQLRP